jgi:hypothetical protein
VAGAASELLKVSRNEGSHLNLSVSCLLPNWEFIANHPQLIHLCLLWKLLLKNALRCCSFPGVHLQVKEAVHRKCRSAEYSDGHETMATGRRGRSGSARSDVDATLVCRGIQAIARWKNNQGGPTPAYLRENEVEATSGRTYRRQIWDSRSHF